MADGFKNLKKDFLDEADKLGIFDYATMRPFVKICDYSTNQREDLKNIYEIRESIKIKLETDDE